jgi:hypothetical protein
MGVTVTILFIAISRHCGALISLNNANNSLFLISLSYEFHALATVSTYKLV